MGLHTHTVTKYWVHCDRCGKTPPDAAFSLDEAQAIAAQYGFVEYGQVSFHVCPDCQPAWEQELEQTWKLAHADIAERMSDAVQHILSEYVDIPF